MVKCICGAVVVSLFPLFFPLSESNTSAITSKDTETPGGMPRIIEDELFERVQHILDRNKSSRPFQGARGVSADNEAVLRLLPGDDDRLRRDGEIRDSLSLLRLQERQEKACRKKVVNKQKIEDRVVLECRKLLTDNNIEKIALAVAAACEADYDSSAIKCIKAAIQEADAAIENHWKALERGQAVNMITERIEKRKWEKDEL